MEGHITCDEVYSQYQHEAYPDGALQDILWGIIRAYLCRGHNKVQPDEMMEKDELAQVLIVAFPNSRLI